VTTNFGLRLTRFTVVEIGIQVMGKVEAMRKFCSRDREVFDLYEKSRRSSLASRSLLQEVGGGDTKGKSLCHDSRV
jgi:hypothetical protein